MEVLKMEDFIKKVRNHAAEQEVVERIPKPDDTLLVKDMERDQLKMALIEELYELFVSVDCKEEWAKNMKYFRSIVFRIYDISDFIEKVQVQYDLTVKKALKESRKQMKENNS